MTYTYRTRNRYTGSVKRLFDAPDADQLYDVKASELLTGPEIIEVVNSDGELIYSWDPSDPNEVAL